MTGLKPQIRKHEPQQLKQVKDAAKCIRSGDLAKAQELLQHILENNPNLAYAHLLLGNVHCKQQEYQQALEEYQQAMDLNPKLAPVPLMIGLTYRAMGDTASALSQFEHSLELDPNQVPVYLQIGRTKLSEENVEEAQKSVGKALSVNPHSVAARLMSVEIHARNNDFDQATGKLQEITQERPNLMIAHQMLGLLYAKMGRVNAAKECFETVVQLVPDRTFGHIVLGNLRFKLKDFNAAEKAYRNALSIKANLKPALYNLIDTLVELERYPEAAGIAHNIVRTSPRINSAHQRLATIHLKQGSFELALRECHATLKHDPVILEGDPDIQSLLTDVDDPETTVQKFLEQLKRIKDISGEKLAMRSTRKGIENLKARVQQQMSK